MLKNGTAYCATVCLRYFLFNLIIWNAKSTNICDYRSCNGVVKSYLPLRINWLRSAFCWSLTVRTFVLYCRYTVPLLTHVHCKPTHFFFHSFIATVSYSLQTNFNSVLKDWADKYHVWQHFKMNVLWRYGRELCYTLELIQTLHAQNYKENCLDFL